MTQPTVLRSEEVDKAMREAALCPFCGATQGSNDTVRFVRIEYRMKGEKWYYVDCWLCGGRGPAEDSPLDAIKRWNSRNEKVWTPLGPITVLLPTPQKFSHLLVHEGGRSVSFIDYIEEEITVEKDGILAKMDVDLGEYRIGKVK